MNNQYAKIQYFSKFLDQMKSIGFDDEISFPYASQLHYLTCVQSVKYSTKEIPSLFNIFNNFIANGQKPFYIPHIYIVEKNIYMNRDIIPNWKCDTNKNSMIFEPGWGMTPEKNLIQTPLLVQSFDDLRRAFGDDLYNTEYILNIVESLPLVAHCRKNFLLTERLMTRSKQNRELEYKALQQVIASR